MKLWPGAIFRTMVASTIVQEEQAAVSPAVEKADYSDIFASFCTYTKTHILIHNSRGFSKQVAYNENITLHQKTLYKLYVHRIYSVLACRQLPLARKLTFRRAHSSASEQGRVT